MRMIGCALVAVVFGGSGCKQPPKAAPAAGSGSASAGSASAGSATRAAVTPGVRPTCDQPAKLVPACGLEYLRYFVAAACACTTIDCSTGVGKDFHDWTQTAMEHVDLTVEPTPAQNTELDHLASEMSRCLGQNIPPDTDTPTPTEQPPSGSAGSAGSGSAS